MFSFDDFWGDVMCGSDDGKVFVFIVVGVEVFGDSEIDDFQISIFSDHQIFGLQIAVQNPFGLQIVQDAEENRAEEGNFV
jgi:hypothetical protein